MMNRDNQKNYKIALYIRASTEEQCTVEGTIKNQEERLKAEVRYRNEQTAFGDIVSTFIDAGKSAKDMKRNELQRMLSAIKKKEVNLVMVTELSRLSRSVKDFVSMNDFFREHGCKFVSMKDQYDTSTAGGEMVMLTMANLAQFERRQVSERVSANFKVRAERGLYNGGQVPYGYKLIPEKRGYLAIDEDAAPTIRALFDAFLSEGTCTRAARFMNQNGFKMTKKTYGGGGCKPRLGHFTIQNTYDILHNVAYAGIRRFKSNGEFKETKASWDAIIDPLTFERAQRMLKLNICRKRPDYPNRYPFLLSGLIACSECGERMVGKTANGNGGKIGYYEHGISQKKFQCTDQKPPKCTHSRVLTKLVEEVAWEEVKRHLEDENLAKMIIADAIEIEKVDGKTNETAILKQKVTHLKRKSEGLAERLSELPKDVSPEAIFNLMRRIESESKVLLDRIVALGNETGRSPKPAELQMYLNLMKALRRLDQASITEKIKIFECLIQKVEITKDGCRINFYAGELEVERGLAQAGPALSSFSLDTIQKKLPNLGSTVLTNGGYVSTTIILGT